MNTNLGGPQAGSPGVGAGSNACPRCGAAIAPQTKLCPQCGYSFKSHLGTALLVLAGLAALGCLALLGVAFLLRSYARSGLGSASLGRPAPSNLALLSDRTVAMANHAPAAIAALGSPISKTGDATRSRGQVHTPVQGPKGRGTLAAGLWDIGDGFTVSSLELRSGDGRTIDLWPGHVPAVPAELQGSGKIYLVPIGAQRVDLGHLVKHYQEKFGLQLTVLPAVAPPASAFDRVRGQWAAEGLIAAMRQSYASRDGNDDAYFIGITDEDIYMQSNGWRFTYSLRQQPRSAVVSTTRMDDDFWRRADPFWRAGNWLQRKLHPDQWAQHRAAQDLRVEHAAEQMITKDIAVLYWQLPLNDDPQSVMLSTFTPDGRPDDLWQSDLAPEKSVLGFDTGCPQVRVNFDRAGNLGLEKDGALDCNSLEAPRTGAHSVIFHLASGMVEVATVDFRQPGPIPIEFRRLYGSYWAKGTTILGPGWSHVYDTALGSDCPGSDACVSLSGLGWNYRFIQVAPSNDPVHPPRWEGRTPESPYYRAELTLDGPRLRLTQANGDVSWFFNCTDVAHPCSWNGFRRGDGATLDFENNASHRLTGLRSGSSKFDLTYDEHGYINAAALSDGSQYQYHHDERGCLDRVTYPDGSAVLYRYAGAGDGCLLSSVAVQPSANAAVRNVLTLDWQGKRATALILPDGRRFTVAYEGDGVYASAFELTAPSGRSYRFEAQADKNYIGWQKP